MAFKTPQDMSNDELLKNEKVLKMSLSFTIVSCIIMFCCGVFLLISKDWKINVFLFLPFAFLAILFSSYASLKGIKKEKAVRKI